MRGFFRFHDISLKFAFFLKLKPRNVFLSLTQFKKRKRTKNTFKIMCADWWWFRLQKSLRAKQIFNNKTWFFVIFGQFKGSQRWLYAGKVYNYAGNKFSMHCKLFILELRTMSLFLNRTLGVAESVGWFRSVEKSKFFTVGRCTRTTLSCEPRHMLKFSWVQNVLLTAASCWRFLAESEKVILIVQLSSMLCPLRIRSKIIYLFFTWSVRGNIQIYRYINAAI